MAASDHSEPRINDRIRAREVRLVSADGEQIGIRPLPEALAQAQQLGLDLVEVADKADPPVCRIMDYGKYVYEAKQRDKASRKKSSNVQVKEMKYRPKIGKGDFDTKTRKVKEFLTEGNRVKLTIMFRGREVHHPELGRRILDQVAEVADDVSRIEVYPKLDGRNMIMVLVPDKEKLAATRKAEAEAAAQAEADASAPVAQAPATEAPATEAPATEAAAPEVEAEAAPAPTPEDSAPQESDTEPDGPDSADES